MPKNEMKLTMNSHLEDARDAVNNAKKFAQTDEEKTIIDSIMVRITRLIESE